MTLSSVGAQYTNVGNPNGLLAGQLGDQCLDTSNNGLLYTCTVAGDHIKAVWQAIGNNIPFSALNNTILVNNNTHTIGGNYIAGSNITIIGNTISATSINPARVISTNNTIIVTNPMTNVYSISGNYIAGSGININGNLISVISGEGLVQSNPHTKILTGGNNIPPLISGFTNTVIFGQRVAPSLASPAIKNVLIGTDLGTSMINQSWNVGIGSNVLTIATGSFDTAVGGNSLSDDIAGNNVGIGYNSGNLLYDSDCLGNVFVGYNAGSMQHSYINCTFVGINADSPISNLENSTAIGWNTKISVNDAINLGNGAYVGINNPSPRYSLDIATVNNQCVINLPSSDITPLGGEGKNVLWVDSNNNLNCNMNGMQNFILNNPSGVFASQYYYGDVIIPTPFGKPSSICYYIINNSFIVYVIPGTSDGISDDEYSIYLTQPGFQRFPQEMFPFSNGFYFNWPILMEVNSNNSTAVFQMGPFLGTYSQIYLYKSLAIPRDPFTGYCTILSTVIVHPL